MKSVEESRYHVPGLDRALSVIELLNNHPEGLRVNDISERLGFPINSVYRIMQTLERRAYARKNPDGSGYVLSEKFLSLATPAAGDPGFLENALPVMRRLRDLTKETVLAGVLLDDKGVVLEQVPGLPGVATEPAGLLLASFSSNSEARQEGSPERQARSSGGSRPEGGRGGTQRQRRDQRRRIRRRPPRRGMPRRVGGKQQQGGGSGY